VAAESPNGLVDVAQLSLTVELLQDAVLVYDEHACIVLVNDRLLAATGYTRQELVGSPALTLLPEALREGLTRRMLDYARAPVARGFGDGLSMKLQRKDGSTFEAQAANSPMSAVSGTLIMVTFREVRGLSLEEIQARGLLESNPDATLICSPEGSVILSNASAQRVFEREHIEMFNQPLTSLLPHVETTLLAKQLRLAHEASAGATASTEALSLDGEVTRRDGSVMPIEVATSGMRTATGMSLRVTIRDRSERQRLQREAEAAKDGFLAAVSHELRTPLTSVLGYGELLEDLGQNDLSDGARSLLEVVIRNAQRELRLVDDLLTMVQIGEGTFRIRTGQVNLSEVVRNAVQAATPAAEHAQVDLVLALGNSDVHILGDADRLGQAVDNLLTNSLKFSPVSGQVTVALSADDKTVTVAVTNEGAGIPATDVEHVFDPLYRGNNAVVAHKQGVGLGLSIVRSIVETHRGEVRASSTPTHTRLVINLPCSAEISPSVPAQTRKNGPHRYSSARGHL
jgi:protein-histidine pros-kinase